MELESIKAIRTSREEIRKKIKKADKREFSNLTFGLENEYNYSDILAELSSILTDVSVLTKSPKKFVQISSKRERDSISTRLKLINSHFESPTFYLEYIEDLKVLLRNYGVRNFSERQIAFEEEVRTALQLKIDLEHELQNVIDFKAKIENNDRGIESTMDSMRERFEKIDDELSNVNKRKEALLNQIEKLDRESQELEQIRTQSRETLNSIIELQIEAKSNEKLIGQFAKQVEEKTNQLLRLEHSITENNEKLETYEVERKRIIEESGELINSARQALNYKTAEGISASFQEQYSNSNSKIILISWIVGAVICLLSTVALGLLVISSESTDPLMVVIGRISLLPIPIVGAIFCANQYTKQKNILEDYAYKMVLAKSIVGFSDQLKANASDNNEEYIHYIKTALEEIHRDPLRSRNERKKRKDTNSSNLNELVELAERIVKIAKPSE